MNDDIEIDGVLYYSPTYLKIKWGMYIRPNNDGYTGSKDLAGRYPKGDDARAERNGIAYILESDAPIFSPACPDDERIRHLIAELDPLRAEIERLREALALYADYIRYSTPDNEQSETVTSAVESVLKGDKTSTPDT